MLFLRKAQSSKNTTNQSLTLIFKNKKTPLLRKKTKNRFSIK